MTASIDKFAFRASIGNLLGLAILFAVGRTYIRAWIFRRLFVDDILFFFATLCLIIGTVMVYVDDPYLYTQDRVQSKNQAPPADFAQQWRYNRRLQDTAVVFLCVAIVSVKFSFMFFFRNLIQRLTNLTRWWWFVLALHVPTATVIICAVFVVCPSFDEASASSCNTSQALERSHAVLVADTVLDIVTDVLLTSIPLRLLWRARISLRKKLVLGTIFCLSVAMVIVTIIRISPTRMSHGSFDAVWNIFWVQAEAAIAVMVVSIGAFRALFVADGGPKDRRNALPPAYSPPRRWPQRHSGVTHCELPAGIRSPANRTGVRTWIGYASPPRDDLLRSDSIHLHDVNPGIRVTHDITTDRSEAIGVNELSSESFV